MNDENFLIQFIASKHCFLQFSNRWLQKINNSKCSCLRLVHPVTKQELRFTWAPQPCYGLNDCTVGINATFAQGLNLHENELVVISSEDSVSSLLQVYLTPLSADDYDILEMSRDSVEMSLLNQIRVVYVKQVISVWVSKTIHLTLTVDQLEPELSYGRLEQLTELVIEHVTKAAGIKASKISSSTMPNSVHFTQQNREPSFWGLLSNYVPNSVLNVLWPCESVSHHRTEEIHNKSDNSQLLCRVHPFPCVEQPVDPSGSAYNETIHPFNVFVHKRTLQKEKCWPKETFIRRLLKGHRSAVLCRLEAVQPSRKSKSSTTKSAVDEKSNESSSETKRTLSVVVRLYLIEDSCGFFSVRTDVSCVYLSKFLRKLLDVCVGSKVKLTAYSPPLNVMLKGISLTPASKLDDSEVETLGQQFAERLLSREGVLINNCCPLLIPLPDGTTSHVLVLLSPRELECWPLTRPELEVCPVEAATEEFRFLELLRDYDKAEEIVCQKPCVFRQLVEEGTTALEFGLQLTEALNQDMVLDNILIIGKRGCGKSRVAEAICAAVSGPPHYAHISVLDCKPLKGKKSDSVSKILSAQLEECVYYQPAVLVLEDLQCIAAAPTNDLEHSQDAVYFLRLATLLKELLWKVQASQCVSVIATAESQAQIHPQLLSARGRHCFTTLLHIPALHKENRQRILSESLKSKLPLADLPDLEDLASKTEGCVAQDLCKLADRVLFKACQRQTQTVTAVVGSELQVTAGDLDAAHQGFVPSDLVNVSLVRHSPHNFASVGGLQLAKELLSEVLIWPTKYPEVFSQCPLRLERGLLLYGAPGTGKTLLANAVVGESSLNFITVKGPELLSKYIGASEEAVRNVFQKAQSAKPCILFFDEFDSLAPRRGHDSTGVTDRVVNQLLTQMDGVEALEGVWVLAAASRPDLLDPALLRPGRIGTLVHCPLPDQVERLAILQSLSSKLQLTAGVDLGVVATQTEGYTGADLQAVLFTAQMTAFDAIHQDFDEEAQVTMSPVENVVISQADLLVALQSTVPSLKPEDRFRFEQLYERFQQSRGSTAQWPVGEGHQRVTLA